MIFSSQFFYLSSANISSTGKLKTLCCTFLFAAAVLFWQCAGPTSPHDDIQPDLSLQGVSRFLRVNDSSRVRFSPPAAINPADSFRWSASMGRLLPGKTAAEYLAPNRRGIATIKLQVEARGSVVYADSIKILVYRQFILLKADDFVLNSFGQVPPAWLKFIDFIVSRGIKASLGLIAQSLEKGNFISLPYLTRLGTSGIFEIWNHGYNHILDETAANGHKFDEFRAAPLQSQEEHLLKAQRLVQEKLGITMHTFGAPGNKIDDNTRKALNEISEIKVWYFGESDPQKLVLKRLAEIELPTFHPNFEQFVSHYDPAQPYLALQIHPGAWNARQFNRFRQIIDFLISRDVTFINPFEYYTLLKSSK